VKGKTYWLIVLSASIPGNVLFAQGFEAAATAAGAKVQVYDGKSTPATVIQGVNTAITAKADGIVLINLDVSTLTDQMAAAKAAGIPVILANNGKFAVPAPTGVAAQVTPSNTKAGTLQADYALYATQCKLNAIIVSSLSAPSSKAIVEANQAEIKRLCPTDCKVTDVDVNPSDIATKLPGLMQSALQRNADTNMILDGSDASYIPGIQVAQTALGTKVSIVSNFGQKTPPQSGEPIVGDTVAGSNVIDGWFFFDSVIRVANGKTDSTIEIPTALVDKTTWGTAQPPWVSPAYNDYQNAFKKLWGLS
jgi:ribose transport system substrate-binding protein